MRPFGYELMYVGLQGEPINQAAADQLCSATTRKVAHDHLTDPAGVSYSVSTVLLSYVFHQEPGTPGFMPPWETLVQDETTERSIEISYNTRRLAEEGHVAVLDLIRQGAIGAVFDAIKTACDTADEERQKLEQSLEAGRPYVPQIKPMGS